MNNSAGASSCAANSSSSTTKVIHLFIRLPSRYFSIKPPTTNLSPCQREAIIKLSTCLSSLFVFIYQAKPLKAFPGTPTGPGGRWREPQQSLAHGGVHGDLRRGPAEKSCHDHGDIQDLQPLMLDHQETVVADGESSSGLLGAGSGTKPSSAQLSRAQPSTTALAPLELREVADQIPWKTGRAQGNNPDNPRHPAPRGAFAPSPALV